MRAEALLHVRVFPPCAVPHAWRTAWAYLALAFWLAVLCWWVLGWLVGRLDQHIAWDTRPVVAWVVPRAG